MFGISNRRAFAQARVGLEARKGSPPPQRTNADRWLMAAYTTNRARPWGNAPRAIQYSKRFEFIFGRAAPPFTDWLGGRTGIRTKCTNADRRRLVA